MRKSLIVFTTSYVLLFVHPLKSQAQDSIKIDVQLDSVSQATVIRAETLERLPQRGLEAVLEIQPAIVVQNGEMHILGGRDDEAGFYLNGLPIINLLTNDLLMHIIPEAIERIDLYTGGYPVHYGGANSGLVNTTLKTGGPQHHFSIDYQTDKFAATGKKFLNTYSYRDQIISATASGPLFSKKLRYFMALENEQIGDTQKRFSKGFNIYDLYEPVYTPPPEDPKGPIIPREEGKRGTAFDYSIFQPRSSSVQVQTDLDSLDKLSYPDGFTPKNSSKRWAVNSTLLYKGSKTKSQLNFLFDRQELYQDDQPMLHILNDRQQYLVNQNRFISGRFEHQISKRIDYNLDVGYSYKHSERYDDYLGNNWRKWSDSLAVAEYTDGVVQYQNAYYPHYDYFLNGFYFERNGTLSNPWYFKQEQQALFGRFDLQADLGMHQIRFGMDARSYLLRNYEVYTPWAGRYLSVYNINEEFFELIWRDVLGAQNYGYDGFGKKIEKGFDGPKKPLFASAYLEDRITHENAVFTFGMRYAYFDTDDIILINPDYPEFNYEELKLTDNAWKDKPPKKLFLPFLGISFFDRNGSQIYFNFGKYAQPPKSDLYYFNSYEYSDQILLAGNIYSEPFGFNQSIIQTNLAEFGFIKKFYNLVSFNLSAFYKTTLNLPQVKKYRPDHWGFPFLYLDNEGNSSGKGISIKINNRRINRFYASFDYTYQYTGGSSSYPASHLISEYFNTRNPSAGHPLDYAVVHKGFANMDYRFGKDDGGLLLEQLGVNLMFRFDSGHPFTRMYVLPGG